MGQVKQLLRPHGNYTAVQVCGGVCVYVRVSVYTLNESLALLCTQCGEYPAVQVRGGVCVCVCLCVCVCVFQFTLSSSLLHCYELNVVSTWLCRCVVECGRRIGRAWVGRHSCECCWGRGQAACNESNANTHISGTAGSTLWRRRRRPGESRTPLLSTLCPCITCRPPLTRWRRPSTSCVGRGTSTPPWTTTPTGPAKICEGVVGSTCCRVTRA